MKSRVILIFVGFIFLWSLLLMRAADLQFLADHRLKKLKSKQFQTVVTLQSRRGAILDRNGRELAMSTMAFSIFADPKLIENKKSAAKKMSQVLGIPKEIIYQKIKDSNRRFVWIDRLVDESKNQEIKNLSIPGVSTVEEWKRVYPNESLLAHTLGFVGQEGNGLEGIELEKNQILQGTKKKITMRRDARGRPLIVDGMLFEENPEGSEIKLTIDSELQYQLETELHQAMTQFEAASAVGIILDAKTSAIRAIANMPNFDPNKAQNVDPEHRRHRAVTDAFEPGSTFKALILAKALKEKIAQPNTKYFCENGAFKVGDKIIKEADSKHKFGWITLSEILAHSSNIGTTKVAFALGEDKVREALNDFGIGSKYGIDLPGEAKGTLHALPWNNHLLANISFGQGVTASPLQMANAYAALVNGGKLNKPYLIEEIRDSEAGEVTEFKPQLMRQVLYPEDSEKMKLMLVSATGPDSTGENARVPGFIVGGKTGTAQKASPHSRGYLKGAYISSFAGFIPASDPRFVIYVAVDQPKKAYYGSQVAAPIFSRLASFAARKEGLAPLILSETEKKNFTDKKTDLFKKEDGLAKNKNSSDKEISSVRFDRVPELKNLTLREVLQKVQGQGIQLDVNGQGVVSEVFPSVGEPLSEDKKIKIILK